MKKLFSVLIFCIRFLFFISIIGLYLFVIGNYQEFTDDNLLFLLGVLKWCGYFLFVISGAALFFDFLTRGLSLSVRITYIVSHVLSVLYSVLIISISVVILEFTGPIV